MTAKQLKAVGLSLGDPLSPFSRSGVNFNVFSRLSAAFDLLDIVRQKQFA